MAVRRRKEETRGSGVVTVLLVLVILAALGAGAYVVFTQTDAFVSFFHAPQTNRFAQALEENNYQAAYTLFASDSGEDAQDRLNEHLEQYFSLCLSDEYDETTWSRYRGLEVFKEQIEETVLAKMDQLVYAYYQDVLTEEETRVFLSRVGKFGFADRHITECVDLVKAKDVSRAAYAEGTAHLEAGEYPEAVRAFKQVREQDAQYGAAQEAIARCRTEYGDKQLERAREMLHANNKNGARQAAEDLLDLFGTYPAAEEFLTSFTLTAE